VQKQNDNLEPLVVQSKRIQEGAGEFRIQTKKVEGDTRFCCKPWVIRLTIIISVSIILIAGYIITAQVRCKSWNAFC